MSIDRQQKRPGRRRKGVRGIEGPQDSAVDVEEPVVEDDAVEDEVEDDDSEGVDVDGVEVQQKDLDRSTLDEADLDEDRDQDGVDQDGKARKSARGRSAPPRRPTSTLAPRHASARQFLHEVNVEMRKVVWPSRQTTINYSSVVIVTLILVTALIFGIDYGLTQLANYFFK